MARKRRVTRKQLLKEPDEFFTLSGKILQYAISQKTRFLWGVGGLVAVIVIVIGANYFLERSEDRAFELLAESMKKYSRIEESDGPVKAFSEVEKNLEALIDRYGSRRGGQFARLIYADICFNAGRLDQSIDLYLRALKDFDHLRPYKDLILSSLGTAYEEKGDDAKAVQYLETLTSAQEGLVKSDALFTLGRIYAAMGQKEKSIAAYKELVTDYPGHMSVAIALEKITP